MGPVNRPSAHGKGDDSDEIEITQRLAVSILLLICAIIVYVRSIFFVFRHAQIPLQLLLVLELMNGLVEWRRSIMELTVICQPIVVTLMDLTMLLKWM